MEPGHGNKHLLRGGQVALCDRPLLLADVLPGYPRPEPDSPRALVYTQDGWYHAMNSYRKEEKPGSYHALVVHECPLSLIELSIELASDFVTVENFHPTRYTREWIELSLQLYPGDAVRTHSVRNAVLDVSMNKKEFRRHLRVWDRQGVYAVFTRRGPLGFTATELDEPARYRALRNYDWTLELAIPSQPAENGGGSHRLIQRSSSSFTMPR